MTRLHHVNIGVRPGDIDAEIEFVVNVLGYERLDARNDDGSARRWFVTDDGTQIHLSEDEDHRAAAKAHVALEVDDLHVVGKRLADRDWPHRQAQFPDGPAVIICQDPAGNRFELRAPE